MSYEEARKTQNPVNYSPDHVVSPENRQASKQIDAEKEQYNYYYNRIYPLLKDGRIDFELVAYKTKQKERRIRETLMFRLTSGEVLQLFGRREGFCYVCSERLSTATNKEPICLACLQGIDTAIQESQPQEAVTSKSLADLIFDPARNGDELPGTRSSTPALTPFIGNKDVKAIENEPPLCINGRNFVPAEQYQAVLNELNRYRAAYDQQLNLSGQTLPDTENLSKTEETTTADQASSVLPPSAEEIETLLGSTEEQPEPDVNFLGILSLDDQELPWDSESALNELLSNQPIRQFGFLRLKSRI